MTDEQTHTEASPPNGGSLIIRNLRNTPFHTRLYSEGHEKPYRLQLEPRGMPGDMKSLPSKFEENESLVSAYYQGIIEVISKAEAQEILGSYRGAGYSGRKIPVVRPEDTQVTVASKQTNERGEVRLQRAESETTNSQRLQRIADETQRQTAEMGARGAGGGMNVPRSGGGTGIVGADDALAAAFEEQAGAETRKMERPARPEYMPAWFDSLSPEVQTAVVRELTPTNDPYSEEPYPEPAVRWSDDPEPEARAVSEEERAAHEAAVARFQAEADLQAAEDRRRAALEEKGVLPEGALERPQRVKIERVTEDDIPHRRGVEDPTSWQNQPGAQPPDHARR